jgi:hypothetical protein
LLIGEDVTLTVVAVAGHRVRLAIDAPGQVRILRAELGAWRRAPAAGPGKSSQAAGPQAPGSA